MLKFAKLYEQELSKTYLTIICEPRYGYISEDYISAHKIDEDDWNYVQRVSLYENKIIGYIQGSTSRASNRIVQLCIWSIASNLKEYREFELDCLNFLLYLLNNFRKIEWSVCVNNPVKKSYRKLIKELNGSIVGISQQVHLINGKYEDEELYEIMSTDEVKLKLQNLITRRQNAFNRQPNTNG